ncbi:glycoside hydrolase family 15 protein [Flagellimonas sp. CMM7]|uniref:glycoside hydrolase family 15 protein n=1 Tax=Flagellimonas sp. CMM7 TaxID=2654676 RepID=UPI0013D77EA4|nr:glycoside hydrolase family 15 protein [Flagellimonas sp. CMM7]UII80321.1 glycoside hydrolase family 15 protein [Flagellimonas sp. CMM7]
MNYVPIENYGIVGNMQTVALVGNNGSIDWFCFPRFDSPSVFAKVLDSKKGGWFTITPIETEYKCKQFYWPDTNVLVTRFLTDDSVFQIVDYMPVGHDLPTKDDNYLVRKVNVIRGKVKLRVECRPAFDYGRQAHQTVLSEFGAAFHSDDLSLALSTQVPLKEKKGAIFAEIMLEEEESVNFSITEIQSGSSCTSCRSKDDIYTDFTTTVHFWRDWLKQCSYTGRWREMVHRSALTLKLLTYAPTGAIVAAPTCSLPEGIGGERNWDYRYTWIRDASFTVYAFMRIGFHQEAKEFMQWIQDRCEELNADGSLQIMYGIDGRHQLIEEHLDHLEGYRQSAPVRIGNGAYDQLQLDIYGELLDAVYLYNKHGELISYDFWKNLRKLVNWVADNWQRKDEGIWEVRGGQNHFVYSKLMSWVALDRAIRLADKRSFPADRDKWLKVRDDIYEEIMEKGWNEELQAFVQSYGSDTLDAANLMMPLVFFVSPKDERMLKTLDAMNRPPNKGGLVSDGLVFRYDVSLTEDGLVGEEGTFNICTFWMVEALTRAGRLEEARLLFEQMLGYANHLGLYSEETGATGEALGNYPQAFTHLALISAAYNLDKALA